MTIVEQLTMVTEIIDQYDLMEEVVWGSVEDASGCP